MRTPYRGWRVVAVSAIGMSTGPGQFAYGSLGLFMVPLAAEFGWSRSGISLALTVHPLALALANPYCGVLLAAIGAHLDYSKCCIVVDEDVDIHSLDDVMWAFLTRGRADTRAFVLNDVPGFYRDPHKDHWGRLAIDATKPFDRRDEFERKRIPGAEALDLGRYVKRGGGGVRCISG